MTSIAQNNRFKLFAIAFSLIAVVTVVQAQRADITPAKLLAKENEEVSVLCTYGKALTYCRLEVPGLEKAILLSDKIARNDGFAYYGAGLQEGQCGLTIKNVKAQYHGDIKCFLGTADTEEATAVIPLTVAFPPSRPTLYIEQGNQQGNFEINNVVRVKCIAADGRPAAKLRWFLDDELQTENVERTVEVASNNSRQQTLITASSVITRTIRAGDDLKRLICESNHTSQSHNTSMQMHVKYSPQPRSAINVFGVVQGLTAYINVTINANPRPRTEWSVDGVLIAEGGQSDRYEAYEPVDLGNGVYNVTLAIAALTLEDTTKEYHLRASNALGVENYVVRISSSEAAVPTGLDIGSIVGIAVGVAVLVLIVALVVVARLTGKWCFADTSNTSGLPVSSVGGGGIGGGGETSDTESADGKAHKPIDGRKKFAINFAGLIARARGQQQPPPQPQLDDLGHHEDDGQDDAARSEATVIIEDDPPKTGEKNLVYAELMLKPASDAQTAGGKEATEYAEIVYAKPTPGATKDAPKHV